MKAGVTPIFPAIHNVYGIYSEWPAIEDSILRSDDSPFKVHYFTSVGCDMWYGQSIYTCTGAMHTCTYHKDCKYTGHNNSTDNSEDTNNNNHSACEKDSSTIARAYYSATLHIRFHMYMYCILTQSLQCHSCRLGLEQPQSGQSARRTAIWHSS